jgi:NAD(P)-dependent dehydrogenase (short-subunit alcohol dehydrogenase family)
VKGVGESGAIGAAALRRGDVTLLINNAGIGRVDASALDPAVIDNAREIFETNFYGIIRASQAFAPVLSANGGGAIINGAIRCHLVCTANTDRLCGHGVELHQRIAY